MSTSDRLWTRLYGTWHAPRRASKMTGRNDQARKYKDIKLYGFTRALLTAHLDGRDTYATTLGIAGDAWAGCKDYDAASESEIVAALAAAAANSITASAILMPGNRAHIWVFYSRAYPEADIRAQLRTIPRTGKGEDYPSGNPIRLPFGLHKVKKTRGVLLLQDERRFRLDDPDELAAGIDAFLALPRNGTPVSATPGDASTNGGQAFGDAYNAEDWEDLPCGGPLWCSPYIARAASTRPDLAKLLRGERVTLIRDNTPDDSDSAQVAALAYNLSSADIDHHQARAIADYLKPQLRPGRTREHFRAHFDAEWKRYKPSYYTGRVIRILGPDDNTPQPLPPAQHKPARKSRARKDRPQKVAGALGYLAWLRAQVDAQTDSVPLSQRQCAERLGCNVRTIKRYEQQLKGKIERRVYARRQAGCLFIVPDVVPTSLADVVTTDVVLPQQDAENKQPTPMEVEHPAPLAPCPAADELGEWAGIETDIAAWERSWEGRRAKQRAVDHRKPMRSLSRAEWDATRARGKALIHELGLPAEAPRLFPPGWDAIKPPKSTPQPTAGDTAGECSTPSGSGPPAAESLIDRLKRGRDLRQEASGYDGERTDLFDNIKEVESLAPPTGTSAAYALRRLR